MFLLLTLSICKCWLGKTFIECSDPPEYQCNFSIDKKVHHFLLYDLSWNEISHCFNTESCLNSVWDISIAPGWSVFNTCAKFPCSKLTLNVDVYIRSKKWYFFSKNFAYVLNRWSPWWEINLYTMAYFALLFCRWFDGSIHSSIINRKKVIFYFVRYEKCYGMARFKNKCIMGYPGS